MGCLGKRPLRSREAVLAGWDRIALAGEPSHAVGEGKVAQPDWGRGKLCSSEK